MHEASFDASGDGDGEGVADGGWADLDFGKAGDLIEAPRKVAQIGISYARASKQVSLQPRSQAMEGSHALFPDIVERTALDLDVDVTLSQDQAYCTAEHGYAASWQTTFELDAELPSMDTERSCNVFGRCCTLLTEQPMRCC